MITVIVPIYNTEAYLCRCIDSILQSSYTDFELILVNDGSDDCSPEICRRYCESDDRIKFIEQAHRGVSAARNKGIEESHGEWIVFVDSDDFITYDFLELIAEKNHQCYNLLIFDHIQLKKKKRKKISACTKVDDICKHEYGKKDIMLLIENLLYSRQLVKGGSTSLISPCAKAYKKSVIDKYIIRFPEDIVIGEDRLFNLKYFMRIQSSVYIEKAVYFIEIRKDSAMHRFNPDFLQNDLLFQNYLKDILYRQGLFRFMEKAYYNVVLFSMADVLIKGVFNPYSTRHYYENYSLCREMKKNKIYKSAMEYNRKLGIIPRRVLLFFYNIECYSIVKLICELSYKILDWKEKL